MKNVERTAEKREYTAVPGRRCFSCLRAARRTFNDPEPVEKIVEMLEARPE
jgi:hypothetical protein